MLMAGTSQTQSTQDKSFVNLASTHRESRESLPKFLSSRHWFVF
jgi:hypothetical protein